MNMMNSRHLTFAVSALALVGLLSGCKEGVESADPAVLVIQELVQFNAVAVGQFDVQLVEISNAGLSDLAIFSVDITGPQGAFEVRGAEELILAPGDSTFLQFVYNAETTDRVRGTAFFDTNGGDVEVDLQTTEPEGQLDVSPNPVQFGRVAANTCKVVDVTLLNRGNVDVVVESVLPIDPSGEFTLVPESDALLPITLTPAGTDTSTAIVQISYCPTDDNRDESSLVVISETANNRSEANIPMEANGAAPCISVTHEDGFSFGASLLDQTKSELFTITNCSAGDTGEILAVESLAFADPLNDNFALANVPVFPLELDPQQSTTFVVEYTPDQLEVSDRTIVRIVSNDEVKTPLDIEITGLGSDNDCPTAVAACSVRGGGGLPSDEILAVPLDVLECTSAGSVDDGTIISYNWSVVSAPEGSAGSFDSPTSPNSTFFVDISGSYTLQLDLVDDAGAAACEPANVVVQATYDEDISAQLTWVSPGDPNEEDTGPAAGTDVDLHFLNVSRGCWTRAPYDCHWRNKTPDWGTPGNNTDDPSLDRDDVDSLGPENTNLNNPEAATYRIGLNYYDDHGFGPVTATIKIFVFGNLVLQRSRELPSSNTFWVVADVTWPSAAINFIDLVYPNITAAPCP